MDDHLPTLSPAGWRWVRFGGLVVLLACLCWLVYLLRPVLTPLLVAAAIAYILNPVVTWFERVRRVPRLTSISIACVLLGALVVGGGLYVGSQAVAQAAALQEKLPAYRDRIAAWLATSGPWTASRPSGQTQDATGGGADAPESASTSQPWWQVGLPLLESGGASLAGKLAGYAQSVLGSLLGLATLLVIIPLFTFHFLWRFNDFVRVIHDHLPAAYRDSIVRVVRIIDAAVANFFRGRLIVCALVAVLTGIGWSIVGVPGALLLGLLAGVLNLVPFLSLLALPVALLFAYLGAVESGQLWVYALTWTMAVYLAVQALESFVLSPAIEGRSSGLHPLAIVVALMIGGQLAGLLGMLLAIPVASTLRTLAGQCLLPAVRRWAGHTAPGAAAAHAANATQGSDGQDDRTNPGT